MSKVTMKGIFYIGILLTIAGSKIALSQNLSDSLIFEKAFHTKDFSPMDSVLNQWSLASSNIHKGELRKNTDGFIYRIYNRFMADFLDGKLFGWEFAPLKGKYLFVQDTIEYLCINRLSCLIDSLSFGRLGRHVSINRLIRTNRFPATFRSYIDKKEEELRKKGRIKSFVPHLKEFYDKKDKPELIFVTRKNRRRELIHFLGYDVLYSTGQASVVSPIKDSIERRKRIQFLNKGFYLNEKSLFSYFMTVYTPDIFRVIIGKQMDYALVEYAIRQSGKVYIAFYSEDNLRSGSKPSNGIFYVF